jgi:GTP-binding protein Era
MNMRNNGETFRSGFVAIIGAPNVGKSTLLNRILGEKISITSSKPQTTRNRILGVAHRRAAQMVFIDTPGIHRAEGELNIRIVDAALSALTDVDLILLVIDASDPDPTSEEMLSEALNRIDRTLILALNKIDLIEKPILLSLIDRWAKTHSFEEIIPISAKMGTQIEVLLTAIEERLPQGPPFFPEDSLTDLPERFIAAEIIREKVFRLTGQEIPYATAVTVDTFTRKKKNLTTIYASIHVERKSQKGIIIGKKGSKLRSIGEDARKDIEKMLGSRVFLKLFVRVEKNWSHDTKALRRFGY